MSPNKQKNKYVNNVDSVLKTIADIYPTLTPQLKKAADYVLDNPVDIALFPIRKSSENAGTTPSTMMRLAKHLGFERYNKFKDIFKAEMHTKSPVSFGNRAKSLQERSSTSVDNRVFNELGESISSDINSLFNDGVLEKLRNSANMILSAKNVYALGFRDTFACAHHFIYVGRIAFPNFYLIRGHEGNLLTELSQINQDDVVIVFGTDPYSIDIVNSVEIVKEQGARFIAITDDLRSPIAVGADVLFIVSNNTPHFFPSIVSSIAIAEALVAECVSTGGQDMVDNITQYEKTIRRLGGYYSSK